MEDEIIDGTETDELEIESPEVEETEGAEAEEGQESAEGEEGGDDDVVVTIGDEQPAEPEVERAPEWVRELRKGNREKDKRIRELQEQLTSIQAKPVQVEALGDEPTLEGSGYDEDKFKSDWKAWNQRKADHDAKERQKQEDGLAQQKAWQSQVEHYGKLKGELKVKDFEDAEAAAKDTLSEMQQSIIVAGAANPAVVVYALGKSPKAAKELAAIKDPVKFAFAVAKLEEKMKVTPRKAATLPEAPVKGNAPVSGTIDSQLERLRADARRTGDYSKVTDYNRTLAAKKRA